MRFHCLQVVRDEADIVRQNVLAALQWADTINVYDTGSTDDTWEILSNIAHDEDRVRLIHHQEVPFQNSLRGVIFNSCRHSASPGDWFVTLDADEFYDVPPPQFVRENVEPHESVVCYQLYDFAFTRADLANCSTDEAIRKDREQPIELRRRYFHMLEYAEPRMFRLRPHMVWRPPNPPTHMGFVAKARIPIRHYSHRDPLQMEHKFSLRLQMRQHVGLSASPHWEVHNWRTLIRETTDPELAYWQPGTPLPRVQKNNHLHPPAKRFMQYCAYKWIVPVLDLVS